MMQEVDRIVLFRQLNPLTPHSLGSGITSGVDPNIRLMQQDRDTKIVFTMRPTILISVDGDYLSKLCPVFRLSGRPPIDRFVVKR
jgi:hypothetical protein